MGEYEKHLIEAYLVLLKILKQAGYYLFSQKNKNKFCNFALCNKNSCTFV